VSALRRWLRHRLRQYVQCFAAPVFPGRDSISRIQPNAFSQSRRRRLRWLRESLLNIFRHPTLRGRHMTIYSLGDWTPELPDNGAYWVAPDASLIGRIRLLKDASIWFGAVLRGDNDWIEIGEGSNVQDNSVIHTDPGQPTLIGANVTVGHKVILHSAIVGDNSLIGMGAILLNRCKIGRNCLIGAGTMITEGKEIPDNSMVLGAPGRVVRQLTEPQLALLKMSSTVYVNNYKRFRDTLTQIA
jgi:carbonic anhydrase/acetyltransferase-like protein (isoleucine patch superfamily)